jgi:hypothetical protein
MKIEKNIWLILLLLTALSVKGQEDGYKATAPGMVRAGEQFQYVIEGSKQGDVSLPSIDGFQLLAGPFSSFSSHSQWINGKMTMETVVTYTHIFRANQPGTFTIPPATVRAGRKDYKTNEVEITVTGNGSQPPTSGGNGQGVAPDGSGATEVESDGSDPVFLRVIPNKTNVYVGEQLLSVLRVYTRVNTRPASGTKDIPYEGFYKKSLDPDASATRQDINGEQFVTQIIQRHILIPQKSGEIVIEPFDSEWMVQQRVQRQSNSVFDSFFDDPFFSSVQEVPANLSTPPVTIHVKPLPANAPPGFTGGVGSFSMRAELSAEEVEVNEALSLKITIRGTGNLPLMGEPEVNLPPDHDLYDVSHSLNISVSGNQIGGSVTYEYPIVARHAGRFRIAPIQFSWFDPATGTYHSTTSSEFNFTVLKGNAEDGTGNVYIPGIMKESVENLGIDIRDITRMTPALTPVAYSLMGQRWYKMLYLVIVLLATVFILFIRTVSRRNADLRLMRNRKASRSALNRFKLADKYRKSGDEDRFYDEVGKAIWGYLADKLGIETSGLSREAISSKLAFRNVSPELLEEFSRILDETEFSRFAPTADKSASEQLYRDALHLIKNLENSL